MTPTRSEAVMRCLALQPSRYTLVNVVVKATRKFHAKPRLIHETIDDVLGMILYEAKKKAKNRAV